MSKLKRKKEHTGSGESEDSDSELEELPWQNASSEDSMDMT